MKRATKQATTVGDLPKEQQEAFAREIQRVFLANIYARLVAEIEGDTRVGKARDRQAFDMCVGVAVALAAADMPEAARSVTNSLAFGIGLRGFSSLRELAGVTK